MVQHGCTRFMREPARRGILRGPIALTTQLKKFLFFFFSKLVNKHWAAMQRWSGCWGSSSSSSTDAADWDHLDASSFKYHYPLILILPPPPPSLPPSLAQASPHLHTCGCTTWPTFSFRMDVKCSGGYKNPTAVNYFWNQLIYRLIYQLFFNGLISITFFDLRILWVQLQSSDICWMDIDLINHQLNAAAQ